MTLAEMLEHTGSSYLDDRTELLDGDSDSLWSDTVLVRYFNHAQRLFCRRAWSLVDIGNATAGRITLQTGVDVYSVHRSVLHIKDVTLAGDVAPLPRFDDLALRSPRPYTDDILFNIDSVDARTDRPIAYASDTATKKLRVYPTPTAAENGLVLTLRVVRLPVTDLVVTDTNVSPEIDEMYHMDLCDYAAGRCLTMPNVDSQAKADGRGLLADFAAALKEARRDRQRFETASVRWSFGSTTAVQ